MPECCTIPEHTEESLAICKICSKKGKIVQRKTLAHLLVTNRVSELSDVDYFFCQTESCDIVYFSNKVNQYFKKQDVRVRVGIKETEDPLPVCYCFEFSRAKIYNEIRLTGKSTVASYITNKVKAGECECEIKNPSGKCCLGEVNKTIKQGTVMLVRLMILVLIRFLLLIRRSRSTLKSRLQNSENRIMCKVSASTINRTSSV